MQKEWLLKAFTIASEDVARISINLYLKNIAVSNHILTSPDIDDISSALVKLKRNKSSEDDGIPAKIL